MRLGSWLRFGARRDGDSEDVGDEYEEALVKVCWPKEPIGPKVPGLYCGMDSAGNRELGPECALWDTAGAGAIGWSAEAKLKPVVGVAFKVPTLGVLGFE